MIVYEVIHTMRARKTGKKLMMIKLDLEKAYDRLSWVFLKDTLESIGLLSNWVELIMNCTQSNELHFLWNGTKAGTIKPSRGIRQGDLLSSYLFVLCIEQLRHMILDSIHEGNWKPITICRGGPSLLHLMFTDNVVLFAEASLEQIKIIKHCLDSFCDWSGQKVSFDKSQIYFSANVHKDLASQISSIANISIIDDVGIYFMGAYTAFKGH